MQLRKGESGGVTEERFIKNKGEREEQVERFTIGQQGTGVCVCVHECKCVCFKINKGKIAQSDQFRTDQMGSRIFRDKIYEKEAKTP